MELQIEIKDSGGAFPRQLLPRAKVIEIFAAADITKRREPRD